MGRFNRYDRHCSSDRVDPLATLQGPSMEEESVKYLVLAVASDVEAERLIEDLTRYPGEPLRTPRWGNAVHATLLTEPVAQPDTADVVFTVPSSL
jgi:hypothetical protein